ncbi:MAG TPA: ATP-binding protein [Albitalea sp.]|uniref:AAA family ATPase n=1 Tax=Piscinibacter sp. TaxID=1903157 RepID=UPI002ED6AA1A
MSHPRAPVLLLMCGVAFAGKTTLARRIASRCGHHRISLAEILGQGPSLDLAPAQWERAADEAARQIDRLLGHGHDVVLDDSNASRVRRDRLRAVARHQDAKCLLVYLPLTLEQGLQRLAADRVEHARPDVSEPLYRDHVARFEPPAADEPALWFLPGEDALQWVGLHEHALRVGSDNPSSPSQRQAT